MASFLVAIAHTQQANPEYVLHVDPLVLSGAKFGFLSTSMQKMIIQAGARYAKVEIVFDLHQGDCLEVMKGLADKSVDAIITDPPCIAVYVH